MCCHYYFSLSLTIFLFFNPSLDFTKVVSEKREKERKRSSLFLVLFFKGIERVKNKERPFSPTSFLIYDKRAANYFQFLTDSSFTLWLSLLDPRSSSFQTSLWRIATKEWTKTHTQTKWCYYSYMWRLGKTNSELEKNFVRAENFIRLLFSSRASSSSSRELGSNAAWLPLLVLL